MGNKYSNVLTMLLVVFIVAILGIIGYFAYDLLNTKAVNANAQSTLDEFQKAVTPVESVKKKQVKEDKNKDKSEVNNPLDELNALMPETPVQEQKPAQKNKVYMEGYEVVGTIKIPKTKVEYPVLAEVTKKSLEIAVGVAYGPGINQVGNTIIFGHNYRNELFFSNNKKLTNGDKIFLTDQDGLTVAYTIYNIYETDPSDASYFIRETEGKREISLQTCTDDSSGRLIIWARED